MNNLKIKCENGQFLEVQLIDYLFFIGGYNEWNRKIIRSLKRYNISKRLNELEEKVYGEQGIEIYLDDKPLKNHAIQLLFLEDILSINNQFSLKKGSLMHQNILNLQHELDITRQMDKLNDELINLELIVNQHLSKITNKISSEMEVLQFEEVLKTSLSLNYFVNQQNYPLAMMNSSYLLVEFVKLLEDEIRQKEQTFWIVLINPESFLEAKDLEYFFEELKRISRETKQLQLFLFSNQSLDITYTSEDIEKTVLLYEDYEQMPEYEIFEQSINRYYPDQFDITEQELIDRFYRIAHLIGKDISKKISIHPKDMVLLKVINDLLGVNVSIETSNDTLSKLEKFFLDS